MGHAPDWMRGSMKKTSTAQAKQGITSRELFHGANVQKFADGGGVLVDSNSDMPYKPKPDSGELNIKGDKVGVYTGDDPVVKYRMNMTDDVGGKSLRIQDQKAAPDFEGDMTEGAKGSSKEDGPVAFGKMVAAQTKAAGLTDTPKPARPRPAPKAAMPAYDPGDTSKGMGGYLASDLDMPERAANFTARGDYVSATDVAAADFMKRRVKVKK